jgi:hypothetical protein
MQQTDLSFIFLSQAIIMAAAESPISREISSIALFISLPQFIASPIIVGLTHLVHSDDIVFDIREILDFLVVSFPLTLSIGLLFVLIAKGKVNMFTIFAAVVGAALLSNLLHWLVGEIPAVNVRQTFVESFNYNDSRGANSSAIQFVLKIFGVYWRSFGPILFVQSCCVGAYAGYRYLRLGKKPQAKRTTTPDS